MVDNQTLEKKYATIKKVPLLAVLLSGAFITILNQTLLTTAFPEIMKDLNLTESTVQWLQSAFMLVNGIMIPVTAFLMDRFTTRMLFLTAMSLFATGTIIGAFAPTFEILLVARIFQGSGAGILMPLLQTIIFLIFPKEKRGMAMGIFGLVIGFAPAIGPSLSGALVDNFPWRSVFYIVIPIALIVIIAASFLLKNITEQTYPKLDILSVILSTLGFGGILYGFSIAGNVGWADIQVVLGLVIGGIALFMFISRQLKLETPILEFRVFTYKMFTLTTVLGMIVFLSMIGTAVILPMFMQNMLGFTALQSGLALLPGAIVMGAMNPIAGGLFDRFGARWLAIIGFTVITITTLAMTFLTPETTFMYVAAVNGIRMFGIALVMMPITTAGLNVLPQSLVPHGTAMNNTFRQLSGSIGTAILVTVMATGAVPKDTLEGIIRGVNMSFVVATVISVLGLVLAFFIDRERVKEVKR